MWVCFGVCVVVSFLFLFVNDGKELRALKNNGSVGNCTMFNAFLTSQFINSNKPYHTAMSLCSKVY